MDSSHYMARHNTTASRLSHGVPPKLLSTEDFEYTLAALLVATFLLAAILSIRCGASKDVKKRASFSAY